MTCLPACIFRMYKYFGSGVNNNVKFNFNFQSVNNILQQKSFLFWYFYISNTCFFFLFLNFYPADNCLPTKYPSHGKFPIFGLLLHSPTKVFIFISLFLRCMHVFLPARTSCRQEWNVWLNMF